MKRNMISISCSLIGLTTVATDQVKRQVAGTKIAKESLVRENPAQNIMKTSCTHDLSYTFVSWERVTS